MKKLKKHNELEVGKYYQLYDTEDCEPYHIIISDKAEISYWRKSPSIHPMSLLSLNSYYYHEISAHSYNRIKRNVMRRLGLVENSNG